MRRRERLLWADLLSYLQHAASYAVFETAFIVLLIVTTLWMGTIGFIDDYIKISKKG
jgi:phospho-N-acetylmuramoyl-pentapeptide-transferase